jgi:hypothetical protein
MNKRNNADDREYQLPRACARLGQLSCHRHFAMAHAFAIGFGTGCQCLVPLPWPDRTGPTTQTIYAGMPDMSYTRRFLAYPEILEEIANLLHNKDVRWGIENQMNDKRGDEIEGTINVPVGEATLTVETSDPNLQKDLDDLISRLEKVHDPTHDDHLSHPL